MLKMSTSQAKPVLKNVAKNLILIALSFLAFGTPTLFASVALSADHPHPGRRFMGTFPIRKLSVFQISHRVVSLAHSLPRAAEDFKSLSKNAVESIPTDLATGITPLDTVPQLTLSLPAVPSLDLHAPSFALHKNAATDVIVSGTKQREVGVVGVGLSLIGGIRPSAYIPHLLTGTSFASSLHGTYAPHLASISVPRVVRLALVPQTSESKGMVLGVSTTQEALALANKKTTLPFIDRLSLSLYCAFASVDKTRCDYDAIASGTLTKNTLASAPVATTTPAVVQTGTSTLDLLNQAAAKVVQTPVYITKYVTEYVPVAGPAGKDGKDGKDGSLATTFNNIQAPAGFGSFIIPSYTSPSTAIGISTIAYLRDTTIESPSISNGSAVNLSLVTPTLRNATFNGLSLFNDNVVFSGTSAIANLFATSTVLLDSTTTNAYIASLFTDAATSTNSYVSNLIAASSTLTDAMLTNSTTTNAYIANLVAASSTLADIVATNATSTNLFATNAAFTNSTTTNAFIQNLTIGNQNSGNALFVNATTTNLFATSSVFINTYTDTLTIGSSTSSSGSLSLNGALTVQGTSTLATTTVTDFVASHATSTSLFSTLLSAVTGLFTDLTATNASSTNFFTTNSATVNATTTNGYISNLAADNSTTTNAYIANLSVGTSSANSMVLTGTLTVNGTSSLATTTVTDFVAARATSTSLFSTLLSAVTGLFTDLTSTNATTTNFFGTNGVLTNATSSNFFSTNSFLTNSTSTNFFSTNGVLTNATTTNFFTTNLAVGDINTTGNQIINGTLNVNGTTTLGSNTLIQGSITLGTSTSNYITVNGLFNSDIVPASNKIYNVGSPSFYWKEAYIDNLNVNTISGTALDFNNTNSSTFTLNNDNNSNDAEDSSFVFFRGLVTPNAILRWNSTTKRIESNMSFKVQNETPVTGTTTLTVQGGAGQGTTNLFELKTNAGTTTSVFNGLGWLGLGTSTPTSVFTISPSSTTTSATSTSGTTSAYGALVDVRGAVDGTATNSRAMIFSPTVVSSAPGAGAFEIHPTLAPTSNAGTLYGTINLAIADGASNITNLFANYYRLDTASTYSGTISNGYTLNLNSPSLAGAKPTTMYGINVGNQGAAGIDTSYGLFVAAQSGATSSYSAIFAGGNVGIGTTTPDRPLTFSSTIGEKISLFSNTSGARNYYGFAVESNTLAYQVPANKTQRFYTGATTSMIIDTNGNVGIGTTTPGSLLSVQGNAYIGGNLTATGTLTVSGTSTLATTTLSLTNVAGDILPTTDVTRSLGTSVLRFLNLFAQNIFASSSVITNATSTNLFTLGTTTLAQNGGRVGIGTTTPGVTLEVIGTASFGGSNSIPANANRSIAIGFANTVSGDNSVAIGSSGSATGNNSVSIAGGSVSGATSVAIGSNVSVTVNNSMAIGAGVNSSNKLTNGTSNSLAIGFNSTIPTFYIGPAGGIGTLGNVGIGTTTPTSLLTVASSTATGVSSLFSIGTSTTLFNVLANGNVGIGSVNSSSSTLTVADNNSTGGIRISGTTAPGLTFDGGSGGTFAAALGYVSASSQWVPGSATGDLVLRTANHNINFTTNTGSTIAMRIDASGNVGIGSTTPAAKLGVNGDAYFGGNITATGTLTLTGTSTLATSTISGWLRVGSAVTPNNTTAGDLTATRLSIGNSSLGTAPWFASFTGTMTDTASGAVSAVSIAPTINPASDSAANFRSLNMSNGFNTTANFTSSGNSSPTAGWFENRITDAGTITQVNGITSNGILLGAGATSLGTTTTVVAGYFLPVNSFSNSVVATISNALGIRIADSANTGSTTIVSQAGINISPLSAATNNTALLIGQTSIPAGNFGIYNASTNGNYFAGSVGIGSTTPTSLFSLASTSSAYASMYNTTNSRGANFGLTDGFNAVIDAIGGGNVLLKKAGTTWVTVGNGGVATTFDTGNVGIGSSTPAAKLGVTGSAYIGGDLTATGTLSVTGASTFTGATSHVGALNASSTLAVTGATTLYSTLTVSGTSTLATTTFSGQLTAPLGSNTVPSYSFTGQTDTGAYYSGGYNLAVAGTKVAGFTGTSLNLTNSSNASSILLDSSNGAFSITKSGDTSATITASGGQTLLSLVGLAVNSYTSINTATANNQTTFYVNGSRSYVSPSLTNGMMATFAGGTNTELGASGTVTGVSGVSVTAPTLAASATTTYTTAATLYVGNAPTAGSKVTITNPYAFYVAAGASLFGGNVSISGTSTLATTTITQGTITNGSSTAFTATNLFFTSATGTNASLSGYLNASSTLAVTGASTFYGTSNHAADILPTTDAARSLGTNALRFLNLFSQNVFATSSVFTNSTTTNASTTNGTITNLFFTSATGTNASLSGYLNASGTLAVTGQSNFTGNVLVGTTTNTFDSGKLTVQGTTTLVGTPVSPTALRVIGNFDNTATSTFVPKLMSALGGFSTPASIVYGKYAYILNAGSSTLSIVDISNPVSPTIISTVATGGTNTTGGGVAVSGRYAYIANYDSSTLSVMDISKPSTPILVSTTTIGAGSGPNSITVAGQYAYTTHAVTNTMRILDISNPVAPRVVSSAGTGALPASAFIAGRYFYEVNKNGGTMSIFDISDPNNPTLATTTNIVGSGPSGVYVSGRYAYTIATGVLSIIDVSTPGTPVLKATTTVSGATASITLSGRYAFTANPGNHTMSIIDVASSTAPVVVSTVTGLANNPGSISVSGRYAYTSSFVGNAFSTIDLGGVETTSAIVHSLETGNLAVRNDITANGTLFASALNVGINGFQSQGNSSVYGNFMVGTSTFPLFLADAGNNRINVGTSTGAATLFVQGTSTANPLTIASSTGSTLFTVLANGNAGVGSSTPGSQLSIQGVSGATTPYLTIASSTGSTRFVIDGNGSITQTIDTGLTTGFLSLKGTDAKTYFTVTAGSVQCAPSANAGACSLNFQGGGFQLNTASAATGTELITSAGKNLMVSAGGDLMLKASTTGYLFGQASTGNFGIGTTTPTSKLHVSGDITIDAGALFVKPANGFSTIIDGNLVQVRTGSYLTFANNRLQIANTINGGVEIATGVATSTRMVIDSIGNVGIGSTTPGSLLSVQGNAYVGGNLTATGTLTVSGTSTLATTTTNGSSTFVGQAYFSTASSTGLTVSGSTFLATASGNVGIGTTSPTYKLTIDGNVAQGFGSGVFNSNAGTGVTADFFAANGYANAGGATTDGMRFGVTGTGFTTTGTFVQDGAYVDAESGLTGGLSIMTRANAPIRFATNGHTNERVRITETGLFGIGTTTPGSLLSVQGDAYIGGNVIATGTLAVTGATTLSSTLAVTGQSNFTGNVLVGTTTNTFDSGKLTVQGTTTLVGTSVSPTALRVIGNFDNTATSTFVPRVINTLSISGNPYAVAVQGKYAYVTGYAGNNMRVIDISNPTSQTVMSTTTVSTNPRSIAVSGRYAYVATDAGTLDIIDISNVKAPTVIKALSGFSGIAHNVAISGQYAYVPGFDSGTLKVIDISNPPNATIVGTVNVGSAPRSVALQGKYAYVANWTGSTVAIVDISNPVSPTVTGTVSLGTSQPYSIAVSGRYAYTANYASSSMNIIDVSSSTNPVVVATTTVTGTGPTGVALSGRYVFISTVGTGPINMIDVSSSTSPVNIGSITGTDSAFNSAIAGRYLYAAMYGGDSLKTIDIGGMETTSAIVHSLEVGNLAVRNDIVANGSLTLGTGLTVGTGGFQSQGNGSVLGSFTVGTSTFPLFLADAGNNRINVGTSTGASTLFVQGTSTANPLTIASSTGASLLSILANGNVGVGTSTPYANLTVKGSVNSGSGTFLGSFSSGNNVGVFTIGDNGNLITKGTFQANYTGSTPGSTGIDAGGTSGAGRIYSYDGNANLNVMLNANGISYINSGNVGIGTTTPGSLLTVASSTATGTSGLFEVGTSTTLFKVLANGNVGIGTTTPDQRLTVGNVSSTADEIIHLISQKETGLVLEADTDNSVETDNPYIKFLQDGSAVGTIMGMVGGTNVDSEGSAVTGGLDNAFILNNRYSLGAVQFGTNSVVRMTIDTAGNIGIGSTTPAAKLGVNGDAYFGGNVTATGTLAVTATTSLATGGGNVGIGVAASTVAKLLIKAGTNDGIFITPTTGATTTAILNNETAGAWNPLVQAGDTLILNKASAADSADTGGIVIAPWSASALGLRITRTGSVGIGTTTPGSLFSVQGNGYFGGNLVATGTLTTSATTTSTYFAASQLGLVSAPAFTFSNDPDTGIWSPSGNVFAVSTGGTEALRLDSSQNAYLGTTSGITGNGAVRLQIAGTNFAGATLAQARFSNDNDGPYISLNKSRGTTVGDYTVVNTGDTLGRLQFRGSTGSTTISAADIVGAAEGTFDNTTGYMPGRLVFSTRNSSGAFLERMRINSDGGVGISTSNPTALLHVGGTYTTSNSNAISFTSVLASSATAQQTVINSQVQVQPTGASLTALYGLLNLPTLASSSANVTTVFGNYARVDTTGTYAGLVTNANDYSAGNPSIAGSLPFTNFTAYNTEAATNGNATTTGTITNFGFRYNGATAAATGTAVVTNYGFFSTVPSGSPTSGTNNNYGLYINGNGGTATVNGTANNYSLYNNSTANSYFAGNVGLGNTNPQATLSVGSQVPGTAEATNVGKIQIAGGTDINAGASGLEFKASQSGSGYGWKIADPDRGAGNAPLSFAYRNNSASWTELVTMRSDTGNVGIGTTTPGSLLTVASSTATGTSGLFEVGTSTTLFKVLANGNVGINNATPGNKLTLNTPTTADTNADGMFVASADGRYSAFQGASGSTKNYVNFEASNGVIVAGFNNSGLNFGAANGSVTTFVGGSASTLSLTASTGVNVGTTGATFVAFNNQSNTTPVITIPAVGLTTKPGMLIGMQSGQTASPFAIQDSTTATVFGVASTGNVGIGTTTPSARLSVMQAFGGTAPLFDVSTTTSAAFATSSLFTILANGSVGIGSTTPAAKFGVNGDAYIGGNVTATGTLTVSGTTTLSTDAFINSVRVGQGPFINGTQSNSNLVYGIGAGSSLNSSSYRNYLFGYNAGSSITSAGDNVIVGNISGSATLTNSVAIGTGIGATSQSVILGNLAGQLTTATDQILIGYSAGRSASGGQYSIGIGENALLTATGTKNVALGYAAGSALTTGANNVILGGNDGSTIATSSNNIIIADGVGNIRAKWDSSGNLGLGTTTPAAFFAVNGNSYLTGLATIRGSLDIVGPVANGYRINGSNVVMGSTTLQNYFFAGAGNTTATGTGNYGMGIFSLSSLTSGTSNLGLGGGSLFGMLTGTSNVALGERALHDATSSANTAVGVGAFEYLTSGDFNTAIGYGAGSANGGNERSLVDTQSGFIGYFAARDPVVASTTQLSNAWALGAFAKVGQSNSFVIGATSSNSNAMKVGIGTSSPIATLSVTARGGVTPLYIASSTGASLFTVLANGNVGIGTSSPSNTMHIYSTTSSGGLTVDGNNNPAINLNVNNNNIGQMGAATGIGSFSAGSAINDWVFRNSQSGSILFSANGGVSTLLTLKAGNIGVGIGTTTPGSVLTVASSTATGTSGLFEIGTSTTLFKVLANGNVGIGTSSPSNTLEVNGTIEGKMKNLKTDYTVDGTSGAIVIGDIIALTGTNAMKATSSPSAGIEIGTQVSTSTSISSSFLNSGAQLDSTHFVHVGNQSGGLAVKAVIGTLSGTTITYSTAVTSPNAGSDSTHAKVVALDSTHFVVAETDVTNTQVNVIAATTTGNSITFGVWTQGVITGGLSGGSAGFDIAALDSTHFVVANSGAANTQKVCSVAGTTISCGLSSTTSGTTLGNVALAGLDSTHYAIIYNTATRPTVQINTISGTSTITQNAAQTIAAIPSTTSLGATTLDSTHLVVGFTDSTNLYASSLVVSGTTVSTTTATTVAVSGLVPYLTRLNSTQFVINGNASLTGAGTISGTSITLGATSSISAGRPVGMDSTHLVYVNNSSTNMTATPGALGLVGPVIGIATNAASAGGTVTVASDGVVSGFSGLTAGATYYYGGQGLTTTSQKYRIGVAVSTTAMLLDSGTGAGTDQFFGDAVFANAFRITESTGQPNGLVFLNQLGRDVMELDETGNLRIGNILKAKGGILSEGSVTLADGDVSELYKPAEAVDEGMVVSFATTTATSSEVSMIRKARFGDNAFGVVTSRTFDASSTYGMVPVAISGRLVVNVTVENGEVRRGDYLTISTAHPGYAMKLTGEGRSIGRAISDYVAGEDKVTMIVETGFQKLDTEGKYATTTSMLTTGNVDLNANGVAIYNIKSLASASGAWSIDEDGRITAKVLCLEDVCIDKTQLTNILHSTGQTGIVAGTSTTGTSTDSTGTSTDASSTASGSTGDTNTGSEVSASSTDTGTQASAPDTTGTVGQTTSPDTTSQASEPTPAGNDAPPQAASDPAPADPGV
jgi:hypothetical protein